MLNLNIEQNKFKDDPNFPLRLKNSFCLHGGKISIHKFLKNLTWDPIRKEWGKKWYSMISRDLILPNTVKAINTKKYQIIVTIITYYILSKSNPSRTLIILMREKI